MNTLQTIKLKLAVPQGMRLNQSLGSVLQGVIMETIDTQYAAYLHQQNLRPYSQHCVFHAKSQTLDWYISALNTDASHKLLLPLLNMPDTVYLRQKQKALRIEQRTLIRDTTYEKLAEQFFSKSTTKTTESLAITFHFQTSTAFRRKGQYIVYPEIPLLITNLLKRWNTFSEMDFLNSSGIIPLLLEHPFEVIQYNLSMKYFSLEGTKIPAFQGNFSFKTDKNQTVRQILSLLATFAPYAGVGIKTAIGMGAVTTEINRQTNY